MEYKINYDEMTKALQKQIQVKSEETPSVTKDGVTYPFGEGPAKALDSFLALADELGFDTENLDYYGGQVEFKGTSDKVCAIVGHVDVVPAGDGWQHEPYGGEIEDGWMYGRGTTDDKGPLVACLYGMKALKDAGFKPQHTIRIMVGCDEETNSFGMEEHVRRVGHPDFGFTPDSDFPLVFGEKGILHFDIVGKFTPKSASKKSDENGLILRSVNGGLAPNAVPDKCRAIIQKKDGYDWEKNIIEEYRLSTGYGVHYRVLGKTLEIITDGVAAHGSKPADGQNAISIMMELLGKFNFANEESNDIVDFFNKKIGFAIDGEKFGLKMRDDKSGELTLNVGVIDIDAKEVRLQMDIRYPVTKTEEEMYELVGKTLEKYELGIVKKTSHRPIYKSLDDPTVKIMLEAYQKFSGDKETKPMVIGGGTYARTVNNIIAFGAAFPGDEDRMHQRDERINLKRFYEMADIYTDAIYNMTK